MLLLLQSLLPARLAGRVRLARHRPALHGAERVEHEFAVRPARDVPVVAVVGGISQCSAGTRAPDGPAFLQHIPGGRQRLEAHADGVLPRALVAQERAGDADDVEPDVAAVEELLYMWWVLVWGLVGGKGNVYGVISANKKTDLDELGEDLATGAEECAGHGAEEEAAVLCLFGWDRSHGVGDRATALGMRPGLGGFVYLVCAVAGELEGLEGALLQHVRDHLGGLAVEGVEGRVRRLAVAGRMGGGREGSKIGSERVCAHAFIHLPHSPFNYARDAAPPQQHHQQGRGPVVRRAEGGTLLDARDGLHVLLHPLSRPLGQHVGRRLLPGVGLHLQRA